MKMLRERRKVIQECRDALKSLYRARESAWLKAYNSRKKEGNFLGLFPYGKSLSDFKAEHSSNRHVNPGNYWDDYEIRIKRILRFSEACDGECLMVDLTEYDSVLFFLEKADEV